MNISNYNELMHFCLDINKDALTLTNSLLQNYNLKAEVLESNLFQNIPEEVKLDLIFFNPVN
jgi:methylase of polypeptide subunit release factors